MNSKGNIFINAVTDENSFTELFTNLLSYQSFREKFFELIEIPYEFNIQYENILTQKSIGKFGQPDITIFTLNFEYIIEIKHRVDTPLTETNDKLKQHEKYYEYIVKTEKNNFQKKLIFLIPNNYIHKILIEENKNIKIITWEEIIELIEKLPETKNIDSISIETFIYNQYSEYLKSWFSYIKFTKEELEVMKNKIIPEKLENLYLLIDNVKEKFKEKHLKISKTEKNNDYGFTLFVGEVEIYLGVWFYFWKEKNNPLSISVLADKIENNTKHKLDEFFQKPFEPLTLIRNAKWRRWYSTAIPDEILLEKDTASKIEKIICDLQNIIQNNQ